MAEASERRRPPRVHRTRSTAPSDRANDDQFAATNYYNNIVERFRNEMPLSRHRRQLSTVDNSFTGKEAVDFLYRTLPLISQRDVTREGCIKLLQFFADQKVFKRPPRYKNDEPIEFHDNAALYVLGEANSPVLRRRSSFSGETLSRPKIFIRSPRPSASDEFDSPEFKSFTIPMSPPKFKSAKNRRLSSSTGDLSRIAAAVNPHPRPAEYSRTIYEEDISIKKAGKRSGESKNGRQPVRVGRPTAPAPPPPSLIRAAICDEEETRTAKKENDYSLLSFVRPRHQTPGRPKSRTGSSKEESSGHGGVRQALSRLTPSRFQWGRGHSSDQEKSSPESLSNTFSSMAPPPLPPPTPRLTSQRPQSPLSEEEDRLVYTETLLSQLDAISCSISHISLIFSKTNFMLNEVVGPGVAVTWDINGVDVRWNSLQVNAASGVVKKKLETDEWPPKVCEAMRFLQKFPFTSGDEVSVAKRAPGEEVAVFKALVSELRGLGRPLLSADQAACLLRCFPYIRRSAIVAFPSAAYCRRSKTDYKMVTDFTNGEPRTRLICRSTQKNAQTFSETSSLTSNPESESSYDDRSYSPPPTPIRIAPSSAFKTTDFLLRSEQAENLLRMPGFIPCPEVRSQLQSLELASSFLSNRDTPSASRRPSEYSFASVPIRMDSGSYGECLPSGPPPPKPRRGLPEPDSGPSDWIQELSASEQAQVWNSIQLILLSLPTATRRRLHHLVRFIDKISHNYCVQLENGKENRYVLIEHLCGVVVPSLTTATPHSPVLVQSLRVAVLTLLIDNEATVFQVPPTFLSSVNQTLEFKLKQKQVGPCTVSPEPPQFCERLDRNAFVRMSTTEQELAKLIESIKMNTKMSDREKAAMFDKFRAAHPNCELALSSADLPEKGVGAFTRTQRTAGPSATLLQKLFRVRNE